MSTKGKPASFAQALREIEEAFEGKQVKLGFTRACRSKKELGKNV